jgi:hypothetical protein
VKKLLKTLCTVVGACFIAGVLAYFGLESILASAQAAQDGRSEPLVSSPAPSLALLAAKDAQFQRGGWVFKLFASANDDPEQERALTTDIVFLGAVDACPPGDTARFRALGVDLDGNAAKANRSAVFCVPGCASGGPPPVQHRPFSHHLDVSASQLDFDAPSGNFAPSGRLSTVEWTCGQVTNRVVAAALIALACNNSECDDGQVTNSAVTLFLDNGTKESKLDEVKVTFELHNASDARVIAAAKPVH